MAETDQDDNTIKVRIPATLTLRDIVTFFAIAVSITAAWGVFGTRLTVIESHLITMEKIPIENKADIKELSQRLTQLEFRVRENEILSGANSRPRGK